MVKEPFAIKGFVIFINFSFSFCLLYIFREKDLKIVKIIRAHIKIPIIEERINILVTIKRKHTPMEALYSTSAPYLPDIKFLNLFLIFPILLTPHYHDSH